MLKLTDYEQGMLDGKEGRMKQIAMENICKYAKVLGAEELCEVTMSTVYFGAHHYLDVLKSDSEVETFAVMNMCADKDLVLDSFSPICQCQSCVEPFDAERCRELLIPESQQQKNERYMQYIMKAGAVRATTCAPYLTGWIPLRGQHFVTTESSNVLLCNSLFGACGNPDGIEASFWATVCGRIPKYGKHDPKNRIGTCLIKVTVPIETEYDWDLLGYTIGKTVPAGSVPVLEGEFIRPSLIKFKQLAAALAIVSDIDMCHVIGLTPEAITKEMAFGGKEAPHTFVIGQVEMTKCHAMLCNAEPGPVSYVSLGCPHYSIYEIKQVAEYLKGKRIAPGVNLQVWTAYNIRALADRCGYTKVIQEAGGDLYAGYCPFGMFECEDTKRMLLGKKDGMAFDGAKIADGLPGMCESSIKTYYGDKFRCMDAAINGYWR